jgi:hypothetical protein
MIRTAINHLSQSIYDLRSAWRRRIFDNAYQGVSYDFVYHSYDAIAQRVIDAHTSGVEEHQEFVSTKDARPVVNRLLEDGYEINMGPWPDGGNRIGIRVRGSRFDRAHLSDSSDDENT